VSRRRIPANENARSISVGGDMPPTDFFVFLANDLDDYLDDCQGGNLDLNIYKNGS
jgi:hypothetical protein